MSAVEPTRPKPLPTAANMLFNSVGSIIYFACQWLLTVLVVRLSDGYDAAGILSLAMTVYNIFSPLAVYRMYTYQISDVEHENTVGEYLAFRIITCAAALVCCIVYSAITSPIAFTTIVLFALGKVVSLLIDVLHGQNQLHGRMDYIGISLTLQGIGSLAFFSIILAATNSLDAAVAGMIASGLLVGILYDIPHTRRFGEIRVRISRKKTARLLGYCLPIVIATIACSAVPAIPRQFLAHLSGEAALGIYASVAAPAAIIQMGASYIYNPLLSTFSEAFVKRDAARIRSLFVRVVVGIAGVGIACGIAFEFVGSWVLTLLFGEGIADYTYLLMPVIATAFVTAYVWFINDLLVAFRSFAGSFAGNVVAAIAAIPATLVLVPLFDMNGVSFACIAAYLPAIVIMVVFLVRTVHAKTAGA